MCLVALAIDQSSRFPLVVAANRDEFFARSTARLAWWSPGGGVPEILSGRDLEAGGTWLGLTALGRLALVTNLRRGQAPDPDAPSRGSIVPLWLRGDLPADRFWMQVALSGYNPFNLIAADFRRGECYWASSEAPSPRRLERGLYGLSNAQLDTPWPKVERLKAQVRDALALATSLDGLAGQLFDALSDRTPVPDPELPQTGVPLELERQLSTAFILTPDLRYGTRSTTLVITERVNKRLVTHVLERSFSAGSKLALLRRSTLSDWPPRYTPDGVPAESATAGPVSEGELADAAPQTVSIKRPRARGLLKPAVPGRRIRS
jgi:uncharacterized protein with NRDE domain